MKVQKLLEIHRQFTKSPGLSKSLGDGFLCQHNPIYGNIRAAALEAGFRFSSDFNASYQALPFSQLEKVLSEKSIPFTDNVSVLEDLNSRMKDSLQWNEISEGLKKNYAFHEACHAVARSQSEKILPSLADVSSLENQRRKALHILLEESFANACEFLAVAEAQETSHQIFYEQNSYTALFEDRGNIKKAMTEIGSEVLVKFMTLAYLHSNFLHKSLEDRRLDQVLKILETPVTDPKHLKTLRAFAKTAFTLDFRFRTVTTGFHLRLAGLQTEIQNLLNFEFGDILLKGKNYQGFLNAIAKSACEGKSH